MVSATRALLSLFHGQTENGVKESALKRNKSCLTNGESANQLFCVRDHVYGLGGLISDQGPEYGESGFSRVYRSLSSFKAAV